jgi:hypothetical protein
MPLVALDSIAPLARSEQTHNKGLPCPCMLKYARMWALV